MKSFDMASIPSTRHPRRLADYRADHRMLILGNWPRPCQTLRPDTLFLRHGAARSPTWWSKLVSAEYRSSTTRP